MMKIALIGATGTIGSRILQEALTRGHQVTAIVRDPSRIQLQHKLLHAVKGDIFDPEGIAKAAAGHDIVISAYGPNAGVEHAQTLVDATRALIEGVEKSGVRRLLTVGGAGTLEVSPGVKLVDTPDFPSNWKGLGFAHTDTLELFENSGLNWTVFHPAAIIEPGERTGNFRTGTIQLVKDENGDSRISAEDYAVAMLNEVENPQFVRQSFTVGY